MHKYIEEIRFLCQSAEEEFWQLKENIAKEIPQIRISTSDLLPDEEYGKNILWITDCGEIAQLLIKKKEAVLFYLRADKMQDTSGILYCIEGFEDITISYLEQIYCRQKDLPWYVLETERLFLREITTNDVERLYALYEAPEITRYMENLFPEYQEEYEYTQQYIRNIYGFYGYGIWVIVDKLTGEVIGRAGIERKEGHEGVELGFMLGIAYQRKGYAHEICKAILQYAMEYLGIEKYYALVQMGNIDSVRLLDKLGFRFSALQVEEAVTYQVFRYEK